MTLRRLISGFFAGAAALMAGAVSAETLKFTYVGTPHGSSLESVWTQPSAPTPVNHDSVNTFIDATDLSNNVFEMVYYTGQYFSPTDILEPGFENDDLDFGDEGVQVFTGPTSAPIFSPGVFHMDYGVLKVTAVPEPTTWAMMLLGIGVLGAAIRREGRRAASA